jgi:hypothetical protein
VSIFLSPVSARLEFHCLSLGVRFRELQLEIQCDGARSTLRSDWYTAKTLDREVIQTRKLEDVLREEVQL